MRGSIVYKDACDQKPNLNRWTADFPSDTQVRSEYDRILFPRERVSEKWNESEECEIGMTYYGPDWLMIISVSWFSGVLPNYLFE